jgi:hypothetical protein
MKKYFYILLLSAFGCVSTTASTVQLISRNYDAVIFDDGVDIEEAKIIGQREVIKQNLVKFYDIENPKVVTDVADLPHSEKYWFISFRERKIANLEFIFMAIIDRQTGKVKFADDIKEEKRWILEAALLGG